MPPAQSNLSFRLRFNHACLMVCAAPTAATKAFKFVSEGLTPLYYIFWNNSGRMMSQSTGQWALQESPSEDVLFYSWTGDISGVEASEQINSSGLPRDSDAITMAPCLPIRLHITEETYVYISYALQVEEWHDFCGVLTQSGRTGGVWRSLLGRVCVDNVYIIIYGI